MNTHTFPSLARCQQLDARDPLAPLREQFQLPAGTIYLDGNSLGALPRSTAARVAQATEQEWGNGLIGSWNKAGWISLAARVGDQIAPLIGAKPGEVMVADSTSINLYKALSAAMGLAQAKVAAAGVRPQGHQRTRVLSERSNFPTDLYMAQSLCQQHGFTLELAADAAALREALVGNEAGGIAALLLTHVNYRSGAMHNMAELNALAQQAGVLTVWDLAHSAGAVPVNLHATQADFAVGCGYKFLNGGPGAPAFVWVHPRHFADGADALRQPLSGWLGHVAPFSFSTEYQPAPGMGRFTCGTPPILSLTALECGVSTVLAAQPLGGMQALHQKALALGDLFIELMQERLAGHGFELASPLPHAQRGSQVSFARQEGAYAIVQALIERGVVGDFRAGPAAGWRSNGAEHPASDGPLLRFGFAPLYNRYADVWQAVEQLAQVMASGQWQESRFNQGQAVT